MITTLAEILPYAARKHADRIALIIDEHQFSFRELDAMSNQVANGLVAIGVNAGDRVSLYGPNSWQWLVSYYGIAKTGRRCTSETVITYRRGLLRHRLPLEREDEDRWRSGILVSPER